MEENQNTNEQEQPGEIIPVEAQKTPEPVTPGTSVPTPAEPKEKIPILLPEQQTSNQQTDSMEVHKHPHHVMHKKKWSEYLLEFFMLFLAVFLGFIAENQREHIVEHSREKKFAARLLSDLRQDSVLYQKRIKNFTQRQADQKHFLKLISDPRGSSDSAVFSSFMSLLRAWNAEFTTATYNQMKTSGSLRYIRNDELTSELQKYYDVSLPLIDKNVQDLSKVWTDQIIPYMIKHFRFQDLADSSISKYVILNRSPQSDQELINIMGVYSGGWDAVSELYKSDFRQSLKLIGLLKEQYHLD